MEYLLGFFVLVVVAYILFFVVVLSLFASEIVKMIALYKISKKVDYPNKYLSLIPILNNIVLSKLALDDEMYGVIYAIFIVLSSITYRMTGLLSTVIAMITIAFTIVLSILCPIKLYKKYFKKYKLKSIFTILSFGILSPFIMLFINPDKEVKNNE